MQHEFVGLRQNLSFKSAIAFLCPKPIQGLCLEDTICKLVDKSALSSKVRDVFRR